MDIFLFQHFFDAVLVGAPPPTYTHPATVEGKVLWAWWHRPLIPVLGRQTRKVGLDAE